MAPQCHGLFLVQHEDQPLTSVTLAPDTSGEPTVLSIGTLDFYVIDREGRLGVRLRDSAAPARADFHGLEYFAIDPGWRFTAEVVPYEPDGSH